MGGINPGGPDRVLQQFVADTNPTDNLIYSSPVFFDGKIYIQGVGDVIKAFALKLDPATNTMMIDETPVSQGTTVSGFPGEVQSVSADGTSNGIVWSPQVDSFTGGPAILRAYNANDLSKPLYSSDQAGSRDTAGGAVRFVTPTIANGMVYLGAQFEVDAYGLLPRASSVSHSVKTPAATGLTLERGVLATAAHDSQSRVTSVSRQLPPVRPVVDPTAVAARRMAAKGLSRGTTIAVGASNSSFNAGGGDGSIGIQSGGEVTTLQDLVITRSDDDKGLVSIPGLKKDRSRHLFLN
jgi:hypothetical protein